MKTVFTYIWSAWCVFFLFWWLMLHWLYLTVGLHIFGKRSHNLMQWVPYQFSKVILFMWGIRYQLKGEENIDKNQQYIYVFNHSSSIDQYLTASTAPLGKYIAKVELLKVPGFGILLKHLHIPVNRSSKKDRKRSLITLKKAIVAGKSPIFFAEGTRNKTDQLLLPFKDGAFVLSKNCKVPIMACTFLNVSDVAFRNSYKITPGVVDGVCDKPFYPEDYESVAAMREAVRNSMLGHLEKYKAEN